MSRRPPRPTRTHTLLPYTPLSRPAVHRRTGRARMTEIASRAQGRLSFLRWAVVTVPLVLFLGFLAGRLVPSVSENEWYAALAKPSMTPPGWMFPVAWTILYALGRASCRERVCPYV